MDFFQVMLCTFCAYLLGSIPSTTWIGKLYFGIDIREHGSGSTSHVNLTRVAGFRAATVARIMDVLKGLLAAKLAIFVHNKYGIFSDLEYPILMLTFGLAAVMGHIFPIFAGLRGGKGFHCGLGVLLAVNPAAVSVMVGISLLIYLWSRYPNLSNVIGALSIPLFVLITHKQQDYGYMYLPLLIFGISLSVMMIITHRNNLLRILQGTEAKVRPQWLNRRF